MISTERASQTSGPHLFICKLRELHLQPSCSFMPMSLSKFFSSVPTPCDCVVPDEWTVVACLTHFGHTETGLDLQMLSGTDVWH